MTDINEIIGRALLAVEDVPGGTVCSIGEEIGGGQLQTGEAGGFILSFTAIGAAVVKALGEAGYEIMSKEDIAAIEFQSAQHLGG